jgi:hypothetical protein
MGTATALSATPSAVLGRRSRSGGHLRIIDGGLSRSEVDGLRLELFATRHERLAFTAKVRTLLRTVAAHMAAGRFAAAGTALLELDRLTEQEAHRALAMDAPACADGIEGVGHGGAA